MRYVTLKTEEIEALEKLQKNSLIIQSENAVIAFFYPIKDERLLTCQAFLMLTGEPSNVGLIAGLKTVFDSLPIQPGRGVKTRLKGLE